MRVSLQVKYAAYLSLITLVFLFAGLILIPTIISGISLNQFLLTLGFYFIVNQIVLYLFFKGKKKDPKKSVLYTFSAVSAKFLFYLLFIVIYYLVTKNLSTGYLIVFFILYLAFTLFTAFAIVKTLKTN